MRRKQLLSGIVLVGTLVFNVASAALPTLVVCGRSGQSACKITQLYTLIIHLVNYLIGAASLLAIGYIFYGAIYMMLARGNDDQYKKAKQTMTNAISGLIIVLLAYLIVSFIVAALSGASLSDLLKFQP